MDTNIQNAHFVTANTISQENVRSDIIIIQFQMEQEESHDRIPNIWISDLD
jgi:hypothetical protein